MNRGRRVLPLPPIVPPPGHSGAPRKASIENGNVTLHMYRKEETEFVRIYSSVWQVKDTRRTTLFLLPSESRVREISVHKFIEPLVEKKSAETSSE